MEEPDAVAIHLRRLDTDAQEVVRRSGRKIDLRSLNPRHADRSFAARDVQWLARILWVSQ